MATVSLTQTAKAHWRALLPTWLLPIVIYVGGMASEQLGRFDLFLFAIAAPLIALVYLFALRPWSRGSISYWHALFWLIAVPGLISLLCAVGGAWILPLAQGSQLAS